MVCWGICGRGCSVIETQPFSCYFQRFPSQPPPKARGHNDTALPTVEDPNSPFFVVRFHVFCFFLISSAHAAIKMVTVSYKSPLKTHVINILIRLQVSNHAAKGQSCSHTFPKPSSRKATDSDFFCKSSSRFWFFFHGGFTWSSRCLR